MGRRWTLEELAGASTRGAVRWRWKECYKSDYQDGKDTQECECEGVRRMPTLVFRGGTAQKGGDVFTDDRTVNNLVAYVREHVAEPPGVTAGASLPLPPLLVALAPAFPLHGARACSSAKGLGSAFL